MKLLKKLLCPMAYAIIIGLFLGLLLSSVAAEAKRPSAKSKFYDFSEQLIDGEIKKPTALYTDSRGKVKFNRLLKLKKSFLPQLFDTAKESVFK
mgnify:CR=1 FL=1